MGGDNGGKRLKNIFGETNKRTVFEKTTKNTRKNKEKQQKT